LPLKDRIGIFRNDFTDFSSLDDEETKQLILLYDFNLIQGHQKSDPAITVIGGLLIWAGWLFMTCAAGYDVVEFDHKAVPQIIAINTMVSGAAAGVTHALLHYLDSEHVDKMLVQDPVKILQSVLSGLVAISASCNNIGVSQATIIGAIATLFSMAAVKLQNRYKIDDPIGSFQIFGFSGIWGCLAVGIFDNDLGVINTGSFS